MLSLLFPWCSLSTFSLGESFVRLVGNSAPVQISEVEKNRALCRYTARQLRASMHRLNLRLGGEQGDGESDNSSRSHRMKVRVHVLSFRISGFCLGRFIILSRQSSTRRSTVWIVREWCFLARYLQTSAQYLGSRYSNARFGSSACRSFLQADFGRTEPWYSDSSAMKSVRKLQMMDLVAACSGKRIRVAWCHSRL